MEIIIQQGDQYYTAEYDMGTQSYTITGSAEPSYSGWTEDVSTKSVGKSDWGGNSTSVTIDEVYNQLILTCNLEELSTLVESPVSEEKIDSPYSNKELWATEYVSSGEGESAINGIFDMAKKGTTSYDGASTYDHYIRAKKSSIWELNGDRYISSQYPQTYIMHRARCGTSLAFLAALGNTERQTSERDNAVVNDIKMNDYMVISVNGNLIDKFSETAGGKTYARNPDENSLKQAQPIARYKGNLTGGHLSPADAGTVNYIVIKGEFVNVSAQHCAMWSNNNGVFRPAEYPPTVLRSIDGQPMRPIAPNLGIQFDWGRIKDYLNRGEEFKLR